MAGAALVRAPYAVRLEVDSPSTANTTIGPWCGGDSRAYHHPTAAAPTAAVNTSVTMSVACQRRVRTRGRAGMSVNDSSAARYSLRVAARMALLSASARSLVASLLSI